MNARLVHSRWFIVVILFAVIAPFMETHTCAQGNYPDFSQPYMGVERVTGTRPLLVILLQSADPAFQPIRTRDEIRELIFSSTNSVRSYYLENSFGQFTFEEAYTTPWLTAVDDPSTPVDESSSAFVYSVDRLEEKSAWVIQQVEPLTGYQFQFRQYDYNQNGLVTRDELAILWVYPEASGGRERGIVPDPVPVDSLSQTTSSISGMVNSSGVSMPLARVADGDPDFVGLVAHELGHLTLGLPDLYENTGLGYAGNSFFSLMSNHWLNSHLDPWSKIKLGWINPTVVTSDGWYTVHDIETYPEAYILYDPDHSPNEYFIVENRFPGTSMEYQLPDNGIAVWHITEFGTGSDWGRSTINLEWAGGVAGANQGVLWDGFDPAASYDFTPFSTPANSRWDDGSSSNIAVCCIAPSAPTVEVFFDVPPLRDNTVLNSAPAALNAPDGSLVNVFALGQDGAIHQNVYNRNNGNWGSWSRLPGEQRFVSAPAAMNSPDGSLASVFATGQDGGIYQLVYNRNSNSWGSWTALPGGQRFASAPAVMNSPDGSVASVFATGQDGGIYQLVYNRNSSSWGSWTALPGGQWFISAPAVMNSPDGSLASVFATGQDGGIYQLVYNRNSSSWGAWTALPGGQWFLSAPAVMNSPDGSLASVFATGQDSGIYQLVYNRNSSSWGSWTALPSGPWLGDTSPAVINSSDGTLANVFALGQDGIIYQNVYNRNSSSWRDWFSITEPMPVCG